VAHAYSPGLRLVYFGELSVLEFFFNLLLRGIEIVQVTDHVQVLRGFNRALVSSGAAQRPADLPDTVDGTGNQIRIHAVERGSAIQGIAAAGVELRPESPFGLFAPNIVSLSIG